MSSYKSILFCLLILSTSQGFCQYTDIINSNRPGKSKSAFSVGTNVAQIEFGTYIINEKRTPNPAYKVSGFGADFEVRYGLLLEKLELNIEGTFQNDKKTFVSNFSPEYKRANFKFLTIGAKYLVFDPYKNKDNEKPNLYSWKANHGFKWKSLIPAVSVYLGANYDTKYNPYITPGIYGFSPKVIISTQHNFSGGWVFVMNLEKDRIGTNQSDFQYILTLSHSLNKQWVLFGETQGIKSDFYADNLFRFGGAYLWSKNIQLDTAFTFNMKNTPSVLNATLGVSYRLDFHKDKEIEGEASEKKEKNSSNNKKKTKDKGKKNVDKTIKKRHKDDINFDD